MIHAFCANLVWKFARSGLSMKPIRKSWLIRIPALIAVFVFPNARKALLNPPMKPMQNGLNLTLKKQLNALRPRP